MEREAYVVIFAQLMEEVKTNFEYDQTQLDYPGEDSEPDEDRGKDCNLIVTGNPGTGKSRFYLYCIFQLILREREDIKQLPPYELVMNYGHEFHKYDAGRDEFVELADEDVDLLRAQPHMLRLVEATSTRLVGWSGVSILFAAPDAEGMDDFAKVGGFRYILPTWSLEELKQYNALLSGRLKLADEDLVSRYYKFGGIPGSSSRELRAMVKTI